MVLLFRRCQWAQVVSTLSYMNVPLFLLYSICYFFFVWFIDCWSLAWLYGRLGFPKLRTTIMRVRFTSYLMMVINYAAGQGTLAYILKRRHNVPFLKSTGIIALSMIIDLYWIISISFIVSFFSDIQTNGINFIPLVRSVWSIATFAMAILMILSKKLPQHKLFFFDKLKDLSHVFHQVRLSDYAGLLLLRSPLHFCVISSLYFVAMMFGVHITFLNTLTYLPIVILIGILPITPVGLGTTQFAIIEFFKNLIHGPIIDQGLISPPNLLLSISLTSLLMNGLLKVVAGVIFSQSGNGK